ncbi:hypothetical protein San01_00390 [Streptomyces angustmyceticus]|uniref:Uncharacterized protein n=1 Tax=Streptomyces angustmyceticus TaxID=285578 RepID=A0A5J4L0E3_9ACTN|nr:hypothetical protein San01_00390 [Streptomyces angustmyceticus]
MSPGADAALARALRAAAAPISAADSSGEWATASMPVARATWGGQLPSATASAIGKEEGSLVAVPRMKMSSTRTATPGVWFAAGAAA